MHKGDRELPNKDHEQFCHDIAEAIGLEDGDRYRELMKSDRNPLPHASRATALQVQARVHCLAETRGA